MKLQKILIPIDFSETSKTALQYALLLQKKYQAQLILVHALSKAFETYSIASRPEEPFIATPSGGILTYADQSGKEIRRDLVEEARWKLRDLLPTALQPHTQSEVRIGDPASEILEMAREKGVDLIVMGTHGRTGLLHLLLGSVAERVIRQAPVPVLSVHPIAKAG